MTSLILLIFTSISWAQTSTVQLQPLSKMEWAGDLRLRGNKLSQADDETRRYMQLRMRLGIKAEVNDQTKAIVRLATATSATSTNQTLADQNNPGMVRRSFGLDLAYVDWEFHADGHLWLGRTANPFWAPMKAQTLFDADLSFEGASLKWEPQWSQSGAFLNSGAYIISENYSAPHDSVDVGLVGLDLGYRQKFDDFTGTIHFGNYHYLNIKNCLISCIESGGKVDSYSAPFDRYRGNSMIVPDPSAPVASRYVFKNQYTLFNAGFEARQKLKDGTEITLFYEFIKNYAIGKFNNAQELGLNAKWKLFNTSIAYIDKEMDSLVGAFTDSDTNGGGTDNKGFRYQVSYLLAKNTTLMATRFEANRAMDTVKYDFKWTQVDLQVSF